MQPTRSKKVQVSSAAEIFAQELERAGQGELLSSTKQAAYAWDDDEAEEGSILAAAPELDLAYEPPAPGYAPPPPVGAPVPPGGFGGGPPPAPALAQRARGGAPAPQLAKKATSMSDFSRSKTSEELQLESVGLRVNETGFWIWRNVIVPPNAYVVHTRRGRPDPVTLGLGRSFRYNPVTDSYLVVPAAMQTIGIFAKCISAEKQGIHVLAYVQWLISDFAVAYKRLDFSNESDPMGIVNSQLREQAEAAIKDTVSTMTVEQVLTDKAPIIQELTERMKSVAEGRDGDGLGLKIVTVQIKEAVVASSALFENLQAPYRHEKDRQARLSRIASDAEVEARSREAQLDREAADARATSEIARLRAQTELATAEASLAARTRQEELAQKAEQAEQAYRQETELARLAAEQEHARREAAYAAEREQADLALQQQLARARAEAAAVELETNARVVTLRQAAEQADLAARIALDRTRHEAKLQAEREVDEQRLAQLEAQQRVAQAAALAAAEVERLRQDTANSKSPAAVQAELVATLPALAAHMPDIQEYRYVGVSDASGGPFNALPEFLAKAMGIAQSFGWKFKDGQEQLPEG